MKRRSSHAFLLIAGLLALDSAGAAGLPPASEPDGLLAAGPRPGVAPPLPPGLNCAGSYTRRTAAFSWFDPATAYTWTGFGDEDIDVFNLPFPFIYYGQRFEQVSVSDNGWISFHEPANGCTPCGYANFPDPGDPQGVIAAFWRDLDPSAGGTVPDQRFVRLQTVGSAPNRVWVVTYERFPAWGVASSEYTFQIALYETTNVIRFQWLTMVGDTQFMSIGIENGPGTLGNEFAFERRLTLDRTAIEYVPSLPSPGCAGALDLICGSQLNNQPMGPLNSPQVQHGCSNGVFFANEVTYKFDLASVTRIAFTVQPVDAAKDVRAFLMSACDSCNCLEGDSREIRATLGPGRYYIVIDGPAASDTGPFNLRFNCEPLLGRPTGPQFSLSSGGCSIAAEMDRYADGRGLWMSDGLLRYTNPRSYHAVRVDGVDVYASSPDVSFCAPFDRSIAFADDASDSAVAYWRIPQAEIVQKVYAMSAGGCCGLRVETQLTNIDAFPHIYELRSLFATDFGPGTPTGMCPAEPRVEAGPLRVGGTDYIVEQNLTCDPTAVPPGLCATQCSTPVELKSADDLATKLVVQLLGPASKDAVQAEWVQSFDTLTICDPDFPEPWLGNYLPTPSTINRCNAANALIYSWRFPAGSGPLDCLSSPCLQPGESGTTVQFFGKGCALNTGCGSCFASADLIAGEQTLCLGGTTQLDARGSSITGCIGGSIIREWLRDGVVIPGATGPVYTVNEPSAGSHLYEYSIRCEPPPQGIVCQDRRGTVVSTVDCSTCSAQARLTANNLAPCIGQVVTLDGTSSTLLNCPGTPTYAWTRDGVPIPGATGLLLDVSEPAVGSFNYDIQVTCAPPPTGLSCNSFSSPVTLTVSNGGTPVDIGNTLFAKKALSDVWLEWGPGGTGVTEYEMLRGPDKLSLAPPGPPSLRTPIPAQNMFDFAGIGGAPFYVYRVRAIGCAGSVGPY